MARQLAILGSALFPNKARRAKGLLLVPKHWWLRPLGDPARFLKDPEGTLRRPFMFAPSLGQIPCVSRAPPEFSNLI